MWCIDLLITFVQQTAQLHAPVCVIENATVHDSETQLEANLATVSKLAIIKAPKVTYLPVVDAPVSETPIDVLQATEFNTDKSLAITSIVFDATQNSVEPFEVFMNIAHEVE